MRVGVRGRGEGDRKSGNSNRENKHAHNRFLKVFPDFVEAPLSSSNVDVEPNTERHIKLVLSLFKIKLKTDLR